MCACWKYARYCGSSTPPLSLVLRRRVEEKNEKKGVDNEAKIVESSVQPSRVADCTESVVTFDEYPLCYEGELE